MFGQTMLEERARVSESECGVERNTHVATEVGGAVRAMADNPEDCGGALLFTLELAALLGWHGWRDEGWGRWW